MRCPESFCRFSLSPFLCHVCPSLHFFPFLSCTVVVFLRLLTLVASCLSLAAGHASQPGVTRSHTRTQHSVDCVTQYQGVELGPHVHSRHQQAVWSDGVPPRDCAGCVVGPRPCATRVQRHSHRGQVRSPTHPPATAAPTRPLLRRGAPRDRCITQSDATHLGLCPISSSNPDLPHLLQQS